MASRYIHTVYRDGYWVNEIEGAGRIRGRFATNKRLPLSAGPTPSNAASFTLCTVRPN